VAEVEYSAATRLPRQAIWDFVRELDHWAPFVTGYRSHQKLGPDDSLWTLKGDLGVLSRMLTFKVRVTEWSGPERVRFELEGVNEPMRGEGCFELAADAGAPAPARGPGRRLFEWLARLLFRLRHGGAPRRSPPGGPGATRLTFRLRLDPGGPMAPMVNAMLAPLLAPAAESLAERILASLEGRRGEGLGGVEGRRGGGSGGVEGRRGGGSGGVEGGRGGGSGGAEARPVAGRGTAAPGA